MDNLSNAEIIRYLAKELLEDGNPHTLLEIKLYVEAEFKKRSEQFLPADSYINDDDSSYFTHSMFAGALRELVAKESNYQVVSRGTYQKRSVTAVEDFLPSQIAEVLEKSADELSGLLKSIDMGNDSDKMVEISLRVRRLIKDMKAERDNLLQNE